MKKNHPQPADHLARAVVLHLWPSGHVKIRERVDHRRQTKKAIEGSLPVFSTDTVEEMNQLLVLTCKLSREDNETYILPFSGNYEDMAKASTMLEALYQLDKQGKHGQPKFEVFARYKRDIGYKDVAELLAEGQ